MTIAELADKSRTPVGSLNNYLSSSPTKSQAPGSEALARICAALDASADELLGLGDTVFVSVPLSGTKVSGGHGHVVETEEQPREIHFRRDWLKEEGKVRKTLGAMKVRGPSMEPHIRNGDTVLFDKSDIDSIDDGAVYVVRVHETLSIKALQQKPGGDIEMWGKDDRGQDKLFGTLKVSELKTGAAEIVGRVFWRGGKV